MVVLIIRAVNMMKLLALHFRLDYVINLNHKNHSSKHILINYQQDNTKFIIITASSNIQNGE